MSLLEGGASAVLANLIRVDPALEGRFHYANDVDYSMNFTRGQGNVAGFFAALREQETSYRPFAMAAQAMIADRYFPGFTQAHPMVQLARANGIKVVLASIPPAADFPWRRGLDPAPKIQSLNARLKAYANSHSLAYADYWSALSSSDGGMKAEFSEDGVHPNDRGYEAMRATAQAAIQRAMHQR